MNTTPTVYCTNCGASVREDQAYCPACGTAQHTPAVTTTQHPQTPIAAKDDPSGLALAGFLCGLLGALFSMTIFLFFIYIPLGIVGIILGILGRKSSRRKLAIAGIVLSALTFMLPVLLVASAA